MDESALVGETALRPNVTTFQGTNHGIQAVELTVAGDLVVHQSGDHAATLDLKNACLQSLHFPGMHKRLDHEDRTPGSGDWVFEHEQYRTWHKTGGIMSITGKAGCGKSMLMEHLVNHEEQEFSGLDAEKILVLWFCFRYNGEEQCRSELGMLRSLLWQVLKEDGELLATFVETSEYGHRCRTQGSSHAGDWDVAQLRLQFGHILDRLHDRGSCVRMFLDGIDECGETMARKTIGALQAMSKSFPGTFNACFTARPYLVSEKDSDCHLNLELETCIDIHSYMDAAFDKTVASMQPDELTTFTELFPDEELRRLKERLCVKTAHCFKWLAWICPRVVELAVDGESLEYIVQQMQGFPNELGAIYEEQLAKILPQDVPNALRLLELLSLDSHGHSLVADMRYAMCIEEGKTYCSIQDVVRGSVHWCAKPDLFEKRVSRWSGKSAKTFAHVGAENMILFTNLFGSAEPHYLQFDHHSVQEFMLQSGLRLLRSRLPHQPQEVSLADARSSFARKCLSYLMCTEAIAFGRNRTRPIKNNGCLWTLLYARDDKHLQDFPPAPPFVLTATREWPYQVKAAAAHSTGILELFHGFDSTMLSHLLTLQEIGRWGVCEFDHTNSTVLHVVSAYRLHDLLQQIFKPDRSSASGASPIHRSIREVCRQQLDVQDAGGRTALSIAAELGQLDVAMLLIDEGARPEIPAANGWTALHYAASLGHHVVVETLLECAEVDVDCKDRSGYTALAVAIRTSRHEDRTATVKLLCEKSTLGVHCKEVISKDVAWRTPHNTQTGQDIKLLSLGIYYGLNTPLVQASLSGSSEILALLLRYAKIDFDLRSPTNNTILHVLLYPTTVERHGRCEEEKMRLLIESGRLALDVKNARGGTPLHLACLHGEVETARMLLSSDAVDPYLLTPEGFDPLALAIVEGSPGIVQLWIDAKLDLNRKTCDRVPFVMVSGQTPLALASLFGNVDLVQLLLDTGEVDVCARDEDGRTPLYHAVVRNHQSVAALLSTARCKGGLDAIPASSADRGGVEDRKYPLHGGYVKLRLQGDDTSMMLLVAAEKGHTSMAELLIRAGCYVSFMACLMIAIDKGHLGMVHFLAPFILQHKYGKEFLAIAGADTWTRGQGLVRGEGSWTLPSSVLADEMLLHPYPGEGPDKFVERQAIAVFIGGIVSDTTRPTPEPEVSLFEDQYTSVEESTMATECRPTNADEYWLEQSASLNEDWSKALLHAKGRGEGGVFESLLNCENIDVDARDTHGRSALLTAVLMEHIEAVRQLLPRSKLGVHCKDVVSSVVPWLHTPLTCALVFSGSHELLTLLLTCTKIDSRLQGACGDTAAHVFVRGADDVPTALIHGKRRLLIESGKGDANCARLLLRSGRVDMSSTDNEGRMPLEIAIESGRVAIAELWVENKLDLTVRFSDGSNPLRLAAEMGKTEVVRLLLSSGQVDILSKDVGNFTALGRAVVEGHIESAKLLLHAAGSKVNTGEELANAVFFGQLAMVRLLVRAISGTKGHDDVVDALLCEDGARDHGHSSSILALAESLHWNPEPNESEDQLIERAEVARYLFRYVRVFLAVSMS
ncbi:hypothetical protein LTS10_010708 [Elasticomyces elasticus]|nr:hypothetical protein LTS10_010708 [Elasticomyces elasticus]